MGILDCEQRGSCFGTILEPLQLTSSSHILCQFLPTMNRAQPLHFNLCKWPQMAHFFCWSGATFSSMFVENIFGMLKWLQSLSLVVVSSVHFPFLLVLSSSGKLQFDKLKNTADRFSPLEKNMSYKTYACLPLFRIRKGKNKTKVWAEL